MLHVYFQEGRLGEPELQDLSGITARLKKKNPAETEAHGGRCWLRVPPGFCFREDVVRVFPWGGRRLAATESSYPETGPSGIP